MTKKILHSKYLQGVDLWLISPIGNEEYTTVVLGESEDIALKKADTVFSQHLIQADKSKCKILNLTQFFGKSGYDIVVAQKGTFH